MPLKCRSLCGPKLARFCALLAVWGVLQLAVMGALYYNQAVSLCEDLLCVAENASEADTAQQQQVRAPTGLSDTERLRQFYDTVDRQYEELAVLCWRTMAVFVAILAVSVVQLRVHRQRSNTE